MKVILLNGSPHENGTTAFALKTIADSLKEHGGGAVETETLQIGSKPFSGCIACAACYKEKKCVFGDDDGLNVIAAKVAAADGIVIGSPVYYAGINGTLKAFLDRLFYSNPGKFRFKPAAGVVAMRRAGGTAALQTLNQYFEFAEMLITPTIYWSGIHGLSGEQAAQDEEGVQMTQVIGRNMAYLLKLQSAGAAAGVVPPEPITKIKTGFIR